MKPKTLFITLSSALVVRNLFVFPGSVWHRLRGLARGGRVKVVVLVNKKDYSKYLKLFMNPLPENCVMAPVEVNYRLSLIQKIYKFFHSYLLYTNTTKILATMGMRPGEPPAGGNLYFAPLKWFIANTLGRSKFIRLKLVPFLYYRIYQSRPFKSVFDQYQPDVCLASSIYDRFDSRMIPEAKRRGVKVLGIPAGWDHIDKYYLPVHVGKILVPSEQIKKAAIRFQSYPEGDVQVIGFPQYDYLVDPRVPRPRSEVLSMIGFPQDARYIIYVSGSAYCPDEPDIVAGILKWIDGGGLGENVYLVVRPYLGSRGKDKEFDEKKFSSSASHRRVYYFDKKLPDLLEETDKFTNILLHSNAVMAVYSTVLLEAAILDKPILTAPFDGWNQRPFYRSIRRFEDFEHFQDVIRLGALRRAFNWGELKDILKGYLDNPDLNTKERKEMRRELASGADGLSSQRVVMALLE